jgi:ABC-type bacteriocin/lantibiotic exporter with double-glycine peptidase domain
MERATTTRILTTMLTVLLSGCVSLSTPPLDVPFRPQPSPNLCGVNCLAMAFDYFHIPYDFDELKARSFVPALKGSPPELLADVAEAYGLQAEIKSLDTAAIRTAIESGVLPIAFIPPADGETIGHFILVTGTAADPRHIRAHDGRHRNRRLRLSGNAYVTLLLTNLPHGQKL